MQARPDPTERGPGGERPEDGWLYRVAWFFYLFLAIGGVLWIGAREGTIRLELFVRPSGWWLDLLLGLGAGALLIGAWHAMRRVSERARELERRLGGLLGRLQPVEVLGLALLSGFAEELFFRGAMQGSWGWLPATVLFALVHTGPGPAYRVWTLFAGVAGLVLAGLMIWRGSLLAPIVAHTLVNGVNLGRLNAESKSEPDASLLN